MRSILIGKLIISIILIGTTMYLNHYDVPEEQMLTLSYPTVLIDTSKSSPPRRQTLTSPYMQDCIRVTRDNQEISYNRIYDTAADKLPYLRSQAHRDAIQLIPTKSGYYNYQMMGGRMNNVRIIGNEINSPGQLQGVFSSDGSFTNLLIQNNKINTRSQHQITINGMLTGTISGNKNQNGQPAQIALNPLRIGGNIFTGNVWVLGFSKSDISYSPASSIVRDGSPYHDLRTAKTHPYDTNLVDFRFNDLFAFITKSPLNTLTKAGDWASSFNIWMRNLSAKRGREGVTDARIQGIRKAVSGYANTPIYRISNTDLLMFALQEAAKRHGRKI